MLKAVKKELIVGRRVNSKVKKGHVLFNFEYAVQIRKLEKNETIPALQPELAIVLLPSIARKKRGKTSSLCLLSWLGYNIWTRPL